VQPERDLKSVLDSRSEPRLVTHRSACVQKGPFTRIIDPRTNGQLLKPFVAFGHFDLSAHEPKAFNLHPHLALRRLR
jgi:hypothetical protein